jgi:hypothetical protein
VSQIDASMASVWWESVSMDRRWPHGNRRRHRFLTPIIYYVGGNNNMLVEVNMFVVASLLCGFASSS